MGGTDSMIHVSLVPLTALIRRTSLYNSSHFLVYFCELRAKCTVNHVNESPVRLLFTHGNRYLNRNVISLKGAPCYTFVVWYVCLMIS